MKTFSLRLTNCLKEYPIVPNTVATYEARKGQGFKHHPHTKFFLFHGSLDILIMKVDDMSDAIMVVSDNSECSKDDGECSKDDGECSKDDGECVAKKTWLLLKTKKCMMQ